ncbi:DUF4403 family protein [Sinorhizobium meliloti]|uniref:DUF4403 family protein n=1 Tax=Rhizobium meliloti TaxID=382 RepID=A0AAW9TKZ1_RHIML|nr:DUF4403 family protein [Sinorhizobium meliloti]MQW33446.1 DUF4403 family protein [Sinorhizobium meliloti]
MENGVKAALAVSVVVCGLAGTAWYSNRSTTLSQPPVRQGVAETVRPSESTIGVRLSVPLPVLNAAFNELMPASYSGDGVGEEKCARVFGVRVCAGTKYNFTARRSDVRFARNGDRLRGSLSLNVQGQGGFRGAVADALDLDAKNFEAAADIGVNAAMSLMPDWCPLIAVDLDYTWTKRPTVEIVDGVNVTISGIVDGQIRNTLSGLSEKLKTAIPCDSVKNAVQKVWRNYDIPVDVPDRPTLHVLFKPKAIGTSGLIVADDHVRIAVGSRSDVEVNTAAAASSEVTPLPALGEVPDSVGKLDVSLPLRADYGSLSEAILEAVKDKPFGFAVGSGKGFVTITKAEIFPSAGKIGIGLEFSADLPGNLFNTSGVVYATARVAPDKTGKVITLTDFDYSRILDNGFWSALSAVFENQIKAQVQRVARIDLDPHLDRGKEALRAAIADPSKTGGLRIEVGSPDARIVAITPTEQYLSVIAAITGTLDTTLVDVAFANP